MPSANVSLIDGRVGDDVEAGQDVAGVVDDDAAAEAAARRRATGSRLGAVIGLDEDERGLDGGVDQLREGRAGRLRGQRLAIESRTSRLVSGAGPGNAAR